MLWEIARDLEITFLATVHVWGNELTIQWMPDMIYGNPIISKADPGFPVHFLSR